MWRLRIPLRRLLAIVLRLLGRLLGIRGRLGCRLLRRIVARLLSLGSPSGVRLLRLRIGAGLRLLAILRRAWPRVRRLRRWAGILRLLAAEGRLLRRVALLRRVGLLRGVRRSLLAVGLRGLALLRIVGLRRLLRIIPRLLRIGGITGAGRWSRRGDRGSAADAQ